MKKKVKHGGARKGAGRPATGKHVVTVTITLTKEKLKSLDKKRVKKSRGEFLSELF